MCSNAEGVKLLSFNVLLLTFFFYPCPHIKTAISITTINSLPPFHVHPVTNVILILSLTIILHFTVIFPILFLLAFLVQPHHNFPNLLILIFLYSS